MAKTRKLPNTHPGETLDEEFLKPFGLSRQRLAKEIHVPITRIAEICQGRRAVSADTAPRTGAAW
ncbi:MAG: addiction module antidote protein, HigA family [Myxococcales bacterium]|nr:addiction module antidote protein, HigA family [Myxococcales bacterium]